MISITVCVFSYPEIEFNLVLFVTLWLCTLLARPGPTDPQVHNIFYHSARSTDSNLFLSTAMVNSMLDTHTLTRQLPPSWQLMTQLDCLVLASHLSPMGYVRVATAPWTCEPPSHNSFPRAPIPMFLVPWHTTKCLARPRMTHLTPNYCRHAELLVLNPISAL